MDMSAGNLVVFYSSAVKVAAGWRHVGIVAEVEKVSAGMAVVQRVVTIDGEVPTRTQSRTGAKRQEFDGVWWSGQQVGERKRISACEVLGEVVHVSCGERADGAKLVARVTARPGSFEVELTVNGARAAIDVEATEEDAVFTAQLMVFSRIGGAA